MLAVGVLEPKMATETKHWGNDTIRSLLVSTVPHHPPDLHMPAQSQEPRPASRPMRGEILLACQGPRPQDLPASPAEHAPTHWKAKDRTPCPQLHDSGLAVQRRYAHPQTKAMGEGTCTRNGDGNAYVANDTKRSLRVPTVLPSTPTTTPR